MAILTARNANIYQICELHRAIFSSWLYFLATNLCSFTHSKTLFLAVVLDFVLLAWYHPLWIYLYYTYNAVLAVYLRGLTCVGWRYIHWFFHPVTIKRLHFKYLVTNLIKLCFNDELFYLERHMPVYLVAIIRKLRIDRHTTTWKIQGELRRSEQRPYYELHDEGPSLRSRSSPCIFHVVVSLAIPINPCHSLPVVKYSLLNSLDLTLPLLLFF
jgi:hypothetical protein